MPQLRPDQALEALHWLIEAGADEAASEAPSNRFFPSSTLAPAKAGVSPKVSSATRTEVEKSAASVSLSTAPGAARALADFCNSLLELKSALETFEGCEFKRLATKTVFADGVAEARIMLIGEAPGREEDLVGLPFVGRAGKLLY